MKKLTAAIVALGMSASVFAAGSFNQAVVVNTDAQLNVFKASNNVQGLNVVTSTKDLHDVEQGILANKLDFEIDEASNNVQGGNVVVGGMFTRRVDQAAFANEVNLKTTRGANNTQGVNVIAIK
ncbi:hypothetical protein LVJ85_07625 [Neisseria sp. Dent CA1/247]|uniref:Uncharacterized protein n=1 Tax=Neisseria zoodegmatis TaxID=326523 RepID=A0A1X3CUJ8_9NEIS|nr:MULTISPECIES: hypothetical protein [Neisseria]OSI11399.1 hypothetical protein BWD10_00005 [Neisseria zoodegmatis]UOO75922.1 hypothetical protein LVJ85_07625 [Neisseria sp. Dent CA1/247]SNU80058.1 Uncharacterised protein [Neisseria zoodegmatis]SUA35897.1 Uncharacterised protein [Neisseria zoodegmatis]